MEKIALTGGGDNFMLKKIQTWVRENKVELVLLTLTLIVGAFLRLYRISEYMTFLGDEGRDAIIVRRLLVDFDPILIGPGTSIGNMFLGPMYYYFIAPGLLFFNFSPVGPSVQIALFGVATIFLVWFVAREWFPSARKGQVAWWALAAAFLYATAPTAIIFSRASWNPNIMPFISLLSIFSIWRVWSKKQYKWLLVLAVSFAFALQSHYFGLLLLPTLGIFWLLGAVSSKNTNKMYMRYSLYALLVFAFLMSPLAIFDIRHNFLNLNAMKDFFTMRQTTVSARPWSALPSAWPIIVDFTTRLLAGRHEAVGRLVAFVIAGLTLYAMAFEKFKNIKKFYKPWLVILSWLGFAIIGLGVFKQQIYDHYYGFFFTAPFLLYAGIFSYLISKKNWWALLLALGTAFLGYFNLVNSPLLDPPTRQLQRAQAVASLIESQTGEERFNLAVIAERNYEDGYQYFLERDGTGVTDIDPLRFEETVSNQLFVVCELADKGDCDPTHNAKAEVANFGWSKIEREWDVQGVRVYELKHVQ